MIKERIAMDNPELILLTKEQVGTLCQLDPRTIDRRIDEGALVTIKIGGAVRVTVDSYKQWIESCQRPQPSRDALERPSLGAGGGVRPAASMRDHLARAMGGQG